MIIIDVFDNYFSSCYQNKDDYDIFVDVFSQNYGNLNALHPFREGNGRAQREFARVVCFECGYDFDLSVTTHKKMLEASIKSFNLGDNSNFVKIFKQAIKPLHESSLNNKYLKILASDDLFLDYLNANAEYELYENINLNKYNDYYREKIIQMNNSYYYDENTNNLNFDDPPSRSR